MKSPGWGFGGTGAERALWAMKRGGTSGNGKERLRDYSVSRPEIPQRFLYIPKEKAQSQSRSLATYDWDGSVVRGFGCPRSQNAEPVGCVGLRLFARLRRGAVRLRVASVVRKAKMRSSECV